MRYFLLFAFLLTCQGFRHVASLRMNDHFCYKRDITVEKCPYLKHIQSNIHDT